MTPALLPMHRAALAAAARNPDDQRFGACNDDLEAAIERIKAEQPGAFHTADTLKDRVFVHAPRPSAKTGQAIEHWYYHRTSLSPAEVAQRAANALINQAKQPAAHA